jgi:hypothetical protein
MSNEPEPTLHQETPGGGVSSTDRKKDSRASFAPVGFHSPRIGSEGQEIVGYPVGGDGKVAPRPLGPLVLEIHATLSHEREPGPERRVEAGRAHDQVVFPPLAVGSLDAVGREFLDRCRKEVDLYVAFRPPVL